MSTTFRPLKLGMVGGGRGAFIGAVHRMAARLDGKYEVVAGCFSSDPEVSRESARDIGISDERAYSSWQEMLDGERNRPADDRIDAVSIVTPNHLHYPVARGFVEAGFHVICDKPLVHTSGEAEDLVKLVDEHGVVFGVTHNYTGYPMVRQARRMVRDGAVGTIRKIIVEYNQGWLAKRVELEGNKQAVWRSDPKLSGPAGAMGDIGSHAENLLESITGLEIESLCADVSTLVPGRALDDDANVLLRFSGGARGVLIASQISTGAENDLRIRIFGDGGGMAWHQEEPNSLYHTPLGEPQQVLKRGNPYLHPAATRIERIPFGHPEGFIEAFANLYGDIAEHIRAAKEGREPDPAAEYPTVHDGARGVRFIERVLESGSSTEKWIRM